MVRLPSQGQRQHFKAESIDGKRHYPSILERDVVEAGRDIIEGQGLEPVPHQWCRIPYRLEATYEPDMILPNGIIIEVKGFFPIHDRRKMEGVIISNPGIDVRFVFQEPYHRQGKLTTPAQWCETRGFRYSDHVERDWIAEPPKGRLMPYKWITEPPVRRKPKG